MTLFDRTEAGFVEQKVRESKKQPVIGEVVSVTAHTDPNDFSNHEASVILRDESTQPRDIPIAQGAMNEADVPSEGDFVIVQFLAGEVEQAVITGYLYTDQTRAPLARAGEYRKRFGNCYIEGYSASEAGESGDEEWVRMSRKDADDDSYALSDAAVEIDDTNPNGTILNAKNGNAYIKIDDTGASTEVSIESDGDITINVTSGDATIDANNIVLNGGGAGVARVGDAVEVEDPDSGTITGTITEGSDTVESG